MKIQKVQSFKMRKAMNFNIQEMKIPLSLQPTMRKLRIWRTYTVKDMQSERVRKTFEEKFRKYRKTKEGQQEKRKLK